MPQPRVECVPNFSEGRDAAVVNAIREAVESVPGVLLLDQTMDPDHHRSVLTFAGPPAPVKEAAVRAVTEAVRRIDLTAHRGVHPRVGAADVVPFVPLEAFTMAECAALAHEAGEEIWRRAQVPVYFYEAAARRPERARLEDVRRGGFEGIREALEQGDAARVPDVGGPLLHPTAGACAVSARPFLIAFNIHLGTTDLRIAQTIAKAIRYSSGGYRHVKALGLPLASRNLVQVSINFTDFQQTPLHRVFETVVAEATRRGVPVTGSELVGLVPQQALLDAAAHYLRIEQFRPDMVLENRLLARERAAQEPGC